MGVETWVRYVLVPGLTDDFDEIRQIAALLKRYDNITKIEVLPFHKTGEYKWAATQTPYELTDTPPPDAALLAAVQEILAK